MLGLEVPMRDLRLMDPALAAWETFAQLLVRDNALVVSAEHVRLLITCDKVSSCCRPHSAVLIDMAAALSLQDYKHVCVWGEGGRERGKPHRPD